MRRTHDTQFTFDRLSVQDIQLNPENRDSIVSVLRGLQHLYSVPDLRERVLTLVGDDIGQHCDLEKGREGFSLWQITVLSAVRLGCNLTYDRLQNLAENHRALMQMLQIGNWEDVSFRWQRIRDNVCLLDEETIEKINHLVVEAGHRLHPEAAKAIRGDSFAMDTNIHYPTDSSLIFDGLKKILEIGADIAKSCDIPEWRQSKSLAKKAKKAARTAGRIRKGRNFQKRLEVAYEGLFSIADLVIPRTQELIDHLYDKLGRQADGLLEELIYWHAVTHHAFEVAKRRVLNGETVPNSDKLFSLFEPDTELIKRDKARTPIQFGHSLFVIEDAVGFICDYTVVPLDMVDNEILIDRVSALQTRLNGAIKEASFDRGFHTPDNQIRLAEIVETSCIPKLGANKSQEQETNASVEFHKARQRHSGVESAIGALQAGNGMKRCRDHTSTGFKRYAGLGILGRNLHTLGKLLLAAEHPNCAAATSKRKAVA